MKRLNRLLLSQAISQPPSGGCVLKPCADRRREWPGSRQPPSGGCVLKPYLSHRAKSAVFQPPSGGCVLKRYGRTGKRLCLGQRAQPPSGGCVLKLTRPAVCIRVAPSAAFGRLCVETLDKSLHVRSAVTQPPSGGCVLKLTSARRMWRWWVSRLRAAVC